MLLYEAGFWEGLPERLKKGGGRQSTVALVEQLKSLLDKGVQVIPSS